MDKVERGYRRMEDEHLFRKQTNDPSIEPDRVSPPVEGYFRLPAIWIGEVPSKDSVIMLNPKVHHEVVLRKKLVCGIDVQVYRDGRFMFDFSNWPVAPIITIPGYRKPNSNTPYQIPIEHTNKENEAEDYAIIRAQAMNVHQVCLTTSEYIVKRRSAMMAYPVTAWNTQKAISFDVPPTYSSNVEDIHSLAQNVINNSYRISRKKPLPRRVIEIEVVEHSFNLFDNILAAQDSGLIQIIEAAFLSACRMQEKRNGEAITLAWGACEQLISQLWKEMIEPSVTHSKSTKKLTKNRRDKLTGRDYTASVIIEMLELNGRISSDIYKLLEDARKARNKWTHEMQVPNQNDVNSCMQAIQKLLLEFKGIKIHLPIVLQGGVPKWPIWMYETIKNKKELENKRIQKN